LASRYVTVTEFARRAGMSRQSVYDAIKTGRLPRSKSGKLDLASLKTLADRTRPKIDAPSMRIVPDSSDEPNTDASDRPRSGETTADRYQTERVAREKVKRQREELALGRERGLSVAVTDVERRWAQIAEATRRAVMAVPARVSADLAVETDTHKIRVRLGEELRQALGDAADEAEALPDDEPGAEPGGEEDGR